MEALKEGKGELLGWHDPDEARDWVLKNKSRELKDKFEVLINVTKTADGSIISIS